MVKFLLVLLLNPYLPQEHHRAPTPKNQQASPASQNEQDALSVKQTIQEKGEVKQPSNDKKEFNNELSTLWFKAQIVISALGLAATVVYVLVTYRMLVSIREQARTARLAAEYAQTMSNTASEQLAMVQRVERPWLLATIGPMETVGMEAINQQMIVAFCTITNCGKTPAWVTAWIAKAKDIRAEESLPIEPAYGNVENISPHPLPPGETMKSLLSWLPERIQEAHRDEVVIYVFGFVMYLDGFNRSHETRFCYRYYPPFRDNRMQGFHIGGPAEYNKQT